MIENISYLHMCVNIFAFLTGIFQGTCAQYFSSQFELLIFALLECGGGTGESVGTGPSWSLLDVGPGPSSLLCASKSN